MRNQKKAKSEKEQSKKVENEPKHTRTGQTGKIINRKSKLPGKREGSKGYILKIVKYDYQYEKL